MATETERARALDFQNPRILFFVSVALFLSIVWVFLPVLHCDFLFYDEHAYILFNSHVNSGLTWQNVRWAFFSLEYSNWYPLTWLSHMLDVQVYGLHPWGHHLTNVLFHALNTVLVFLVFRKLMRLGAEGLAAQAVADWGGLMIALLFGLHPLHVQSVASISERKDVLSTMFWLLAIWSYIKYVTSGGWRVTRKQGNDKSFYLLTLLFFLLGLMSKTMVVTLPFVFLLLDYWPLGRARNAKRKAGNWGKLILEKAPFFVLVVLVSVLACIAQRQGAYLQETLDLSVGARFENALVAYLRYLGKCFWPANLCSHYPHPGHWPMIAVLFAGFALLAISFFAWTQRTRRPSLIIGWFWYLGTLVPAIGLTRWSLAAQSMADHYTYIPLIGIFLILTCLIAEGTALLSYQKLILSAVTITVLAVCIPLTRYQIGFWKDNVTLLTHAIAVTQDNYVAHNNLGILLQPTDPNAAFDHFQEAVRIKPDFADAQRNLAGQLYDRGQYDEAVVHYKKSLELDPNCAWAESGLAFALYKTGHADEYMIHLEKAAAIDPADAGRQYVLGVALYEARQKDQAVVHLKRAIERDPSNASYQNALGAALLGSGHVDEAITAFQEALRLQPGSTEAQKNLDSALAAKRQR